MQGFLPFLKLSRNQILSEISAGWKIAHIYFPINFFPKRSHRFSSAQIQFMSTSCGWNRIVLLGGKKYSIWDIFCKNPDLFQTLLKILEII